jgi:hypothetical protein
MDGEDGDAAVEALEQSADPVTDVSQPTPPATIPGPRRQRNVLRSASFEREEAERVIHAERRAYSTNVPRLPSRCDKSERRSPEHIPEHLLAAFDGASGLFEIESIHLVAAFGEQRRRPPTALASMKVAVKEQFLRRILNHSAVLGMLGQRPLAAPVRNDADGQPPPDEWREIPDDAVGLTRVRGSGVVDAHEEWPHVLDVAWWVVA